MGLTHFPNGVSTFGYPVVPPIPFSGDSQYYYVDAVNGNDGNSGTDPSQAFQTVGKGYAQLRDGHYDTLFLIGLGTAFTLATSLVWAKNYTNLVGITAPLQTSQRVRITSGIVNTLTPLVTFSGTGITVKNLQIAQFGNSATTSAQNVLVNGQRNYFEDVHFLGGGNATNRGGTLMRSLTIDGNGTNGYGEHVFNRCTIGTDATSTAGACFELDFLNFTQRNLFRDCIFNRTASVATGGFINVPASGILRWQFFDRCLFLNDTDGTGLTHAITLTATSGLIIMRQAMLSGGISWCGSGKANFLMEGINAATTIGIAYEPTS
jgi:hypothetical protein